MTKRKSYSKEYKNSPQASRVLKQTELFRPIFLLLVLCKLISNVSSNYILVGITYRFNKVTLTRMALT